ncbi:hypothetical protein B4099_2423 [Heyndrickxia coagulans]|uniref:Uncharacterized protein n=1 Tax=Heyndrickxia coagulans TaxID=1398 RepID=A0A150KFC5_HEYCO|nr:hypothetical protein B4099_2423 [Heyndrickxia coagulans]
MSFIGVMKDKMETREQRNVLHRGDEGQTALPEPPKCLSFTD